MPGEWGYSDMAPIGVTNETFCNYLADSWTTWAPTGFPGGWHVACEGRSYFKIVN